MRTLVWCLALSCGAAAAAAEVSGEVGASLASRYVWRGMTLTDGPVLQPWASASAYGVSFGVWANTELDNANGLAGETSEVDLTLGYEFVAGPVAMNVGALAYFFPATGDSATAELFLEASLADAPFSPGVAVYRDVKEVKSLYASLSASRSVPVRGASVDISLSLGVGDGAYFEGYFGTSASAGLADIALAAESSFDLRDSLALTVGAQVSSVLRGELRDALSLAGMPREAFALSVSISYSF